MNSSSRSIAGGRGYFLLFALVVLAFSSAPLAGEVFRLEASPWLWVTLRDPSRVPDFSAQLLATWEYGAFYSLGFFVPFFLITLALFLRRHAASPYMVSPLPAHHWRTRLYASLGCLLLYLVLLGPLVAFARALPGGAWNGWLLIASLVVAAMFFGAAWSAAHSVTRE